MKVHCLVFLLLLCLGPVPTSGFAGDDVEPEREAPSTETAEPAAKEPPADEAPFVALDFDRVERRIVKEPTYKVQPRYALFIFGPEAKTRIWAVLDKSNTMYDYYDVLYFDRNGDGDLTQEDERIEGEFNEAGSKAGMGLVLKIGDFAVPGTDLVHKGLLVSTIRKAGRSGIWFRMAYNGKTKISGGMLCNGSCTEWGKTVEEAPILRPTIKGRLSFGFYGWGASTIKLTIGDRKNVSLILGNRGSGADTLCAVDEDFLEPRTDKIKYTLIAKTKRGKEVTAKGTITEHC